MVAPILKRYAIVDGINVINVIEYGWPPENPPPGFSDACIAIQSDVAGPGWVYQEGVFTNPNPPVSPPPYPVEPK